MGRIAKHTCVFEQKQDGFRVMAHCQDCLCVCVARRCVVLTHPSRLCLSRCTCLVWSGWWTPSRTQCATEGQQRVEGWEVC